jgi:hypothetical protein
MTEPTTDTPADQANVEDIPVTLLPEPDEPVDDALDPDDTHVEGVDAR